MSDNDRQDEINALEAQVDELEDEKAALEGKVKMAETAFRDLANQLDSVRDDVSTLASDARTAYNDI